MVILVMGVTGSGKTTVGKLLAEKLGWNFVDADDFHSIPNVEKISHGIPLEDTDREPWLKNLSAAMTRWTQEKENVVLACSALKHSYRKALDVGGWAETKIVYLKGSYDLIYERLRQRHNHFATEAILASQFADLEELGGTDKECAIVLDVSQTPKQLVAEIEVRLSLPKKELS